MINVCDALCGCGKTSSCINMMNEQTDRKFIFVTQYLDEVERIIEGCSGRDFKQPKRDEETGQTKLSDVERLIAEGANIATTHSLFRSYTEETKRLIEEHKYTLILDEVVDVLTSADIAGCDMDLLRKSETIKEEDGFVQWVGDDYADNNGRFRDEMLRAKSHNFLKYDDRYFFWAITPELFTSFEDVYILTYLFEAQMLRCFFDMYGLEYNLLGTKIDSGKYQFCDVSEMDRSRDLREMVHIIENEKLNAIGSNRTDLSFSWYKKNTADKERDELERLQRNISNVFKNIFKTTMRDFLWTTFTDSKDALSGRGYANSFIAYNLRASNKFGQRHYLAYCVNNFPRPLEVKYFRDHGVEVNADMYALSTLVQWIFRSAIRNGEEIWVYVPSVRMRYLLKEWINNLAEGRDLTPIEYRSPRKNYYMKKKNNKRKDT